MISSEKGYKSKVFNQLENVLAGRGYTGIKAKGLYYWLWRVTENFPIYCWHGNYGQNKVFIGAEHADLEKILSNIKGVLPSSQGTTKNSKFEAFRFNKVNPHSGIIEYEGWRFQFIDSSAANKFLSVCEEYAHRGLDAAKETSLTWEQIPVKVTSKSSTVSTRIGQENFRKKLVGYWKTCAVTGCNLTSILKSSHIKPWFKSDSRERLDPFNGLLLIPNLDCLFDSGFISFSNTGEIIISERVSPEVLISMGISASMRLRKINTAHIPYLQYHRVEIFKF